MNITGALQEIDREWQERSSLSQFSPETLRLIERILKRLEEDNEQIARFLKARRESPGFQRMVNYIMERVDRK